MRLFDEPQELEVQRCVAAYMVSQCSVTRVPLSIKRLAYAHVCSVHAHSPECVGESTKNASAGSHPPAFSAAVAECLIDGKLNSVRLSIIPASHARTRERLTNVTFSGHFYQTANERCYLWTTSEGLLDVIEGIFHRRESKR